MKFGLKNSSTKMLLNIGAGTLAAIMLTACGGGGGDPGASNATAVASRYTVNLIPKTNSAVFGGNDITADISVFNNCVETIITEDSGSGVKSTTIRAPIQSDCGNLPLDTVVGKVVTVSSSNPAAVTFTQVNVITDKDGTAQVTISAANSNFSGIVEITASVTLSGHTYSASPVSINVN